MADHINLEVEIEYIIKDKDGNIKKKGTIDTKKVQNGRNKLKKNN